MVIPPVVSAPSTSRTYRSSRSAALAMSALVDGGRSAIVSNSPVWWPRLIDRDSSASLRRPPIRPANSSMRVGSRSVVVMRFAPLVAIGVVR